MAKNEKMVIVGCRLPHGIVIEHPMNPSQKVTLKGLNGIVIIGATYGITHVEESFMNEWLAVNSDFAAVKSGAIFIAKDEASLSSMAKDVSTSLTGFEPMRTDGKDDRAKGVKTTDDKE